MGELDEKLRREALSTKPGPDPRSSADFEEIKRAHHAAVLQKVYLKTLGIDSPDGHGGAKPSGVNMTLDIGELVKAQSDNTMKAITAISEAQAKRPEDPFLIYTLNELKEIRAKLESSSSDPLQSLLAAQEVLDTLAEKMKQRAGVGQAAPGGIQDIPALISLEDAKAEREEKARQWQEMMEERRHQWTVETEDRRHQYEIADRQWRQEFGLRKQESEDSRATRGQAAQGLQDLVTSLAGAIDERMSPGQQTTLTKSSGSKAGPGLELSPEHPSVDCECGSPITIPAGAQHGTQVTCESCGSTFQLSPKPAAEQPAKSGAT